jgi:citrate lyase subunit beta/citryl-CoA lyase
VEVEQARHGTPTTRIHSRVEALYGDSIRALLRSVLEELNAADLSVTLDDSGALPYVLVARLEAAVRRLRPAAPPTDLPEVNPATRYASSRQRPRRSRLYLPGNIPKFFINAGLHGPDAVILDLEDSVPPAEKDSARLLARSALRAVSFYGAEKMVRINQLPAGLDDVRALAPHGVHTFVIPKVESPEEVLAVQTLLDELQREGSASDDIYLIPIIESARGVLQAWPIASASPRIVALTIGLEDYTSDIGAQRTPEGRESLWARGQIVNAARAAGLQPLASVFSDLDDLPGLRAWAEEARAFGFEGMGCLHPRQVRVAHEAFTPGPDEIEKAGRIVAAFREARAAGLGVAAVDNKMVDAPIAARAMRLLHLAQAASRLPEHWQALLNSETDGPR